jgi:hypothetical protein
MLLSIMPVTWNSPPPDLVQINTGWGGEVDGTSGDALARLRTAS